MTPTELIADLDEALAEDGELINLQRMNAGAIAVQVTCPAFVRGYTPQELAGNITQHDLKVILSPTQIVGAGWQAFIGGGNQDARVPIKNNRCLIAGRVRNVEAAAGIYVAGELVRIEMQVRG